MQSTHRGAEIKNQPEQKKSQTTQPSYQTVKVAEEAIDALSWAIVLDGIGDFVSGVLD